jgi:hypothetical protein
MAEVMKAAVCWLINACRYVLRHEYLLAFVGA